MSKKKQNIASKVRNLVENVITDMGYTLWDVTYYKEGADMILEISVDKNAGVSLDDCSKITKTVEPLIDELDPIQGSYCLMVSSAGTDRELRTIDHIKYAIEKKLPVVIKLFSAFEGEKKFSGSIKYADKDNITIIRDQIENEIVLPKKLISKITTFTNETYPNK